MTCCGECSYLPKRRYAGQCLVLVRGQGTLIILGSLYLLAINGNDQQPSDATGSISRMNLSSSSLLVPLTFSKTQTTSRIDSSSILEASCSRSQPCVMRSWGVPGDPSLGVEVERRTVRGTVIGSKDGTLYVFKQSRPAAAAVGLQRPESLLSRPTSPWRRESRTTSRSSTPSTSSPAPFNVTPRSRIVSGVTNEQVEAPKNYVDFDDEPDKLKDMLRGRSPRERKETPHNSDVDSKSPPPSFLGLPDVTMKHRSVMKPSLSTTELLAATASSVSTSTWDRASFIHDLTLWCHIVPLRSGPRRAVTSIRFLDRNRSLAVLQEMGSVFKQITNEPYSGYIFRDLSIFSLQDGSCLASINAEHVRINPPDGIRDRDVSHDVLLWNHLEVYHVGQVRQASPYSLCLFNMYISDSLWYYLHPLQSTPILRCLPHWTQMIMVPSRNLS